MTIRFRQVVAASRFNAYRQLPMQRGISSLRTVKSIWPYVWPRSDPEAGATRIRIGTAFGLLVAGKALNVQVPFLFKHIVERVNEALGSDIAVNLDLFTLSGSVLLGYTAARLGASVFNELRNVVFSRVSQAAQRQVARRSLAHLHDLGHSFHVKQNTAALGKAIERGTKGVNFIFIATLFNIVPTAVEVAFVCGLLGSQFGTVYVGAAVGTLGAYTAYTIAMTSWRTRFRKEMNSAESLAAARMHDSLLHQEAVKQFGNEQFEIRQYDAALKTYEEASQKTASSLAFLNIGQQAIFTASLGGLMALTTARILAGEATVGDLVLVNGLIFQLSLPLNFLGSIWRELRQALVDVESLCNLQELETDIRALPSHDVTVSTPAEITFESVSFSYDINRKVLDNLSLIIPAGAKVAVVGPSGSGKSTLVRLLLRFYEPSSGKVKIGEQNIQDIPLAELRRSIGLIPQDPAIFNRTVAYNIAYSRPEASTEDISKAAEMARLSQLVRTLPEGLDTLIGERGVSLSGGERQRISLARLFLRPPTPVLLLDEATSALDTRTEVDILDAIESRRQECKQTLVIIAHRLASIADADLILTMKDGALAEYGTHSELIDKRGVYYDLWQAQNHEVTS